VDFAIESNGDEGSSSFIILLSHFLERHFSENGHGVFPVKVEQDRIHRVGDASCSIGNRYHYIVSVWASGCWEFLAA
jgi:hypothetical protein